jgi:5'-3' exonuclease
MINIAQPKKGIYLAIDGVAPVAKMKQQRLRRYKSINDKALFDNIKRKHNKAIPFFWSNSAITPGTEFMVKLTKIINDWAKILKCIRNKY